MLLWWQEVPQDKTTTIPTSPVGCNGIVLSQSEEGEEGEGSSKSEGQR